MSRHVPNHASDSFLFLQITLHQPQYSLNISVAKTEDILTKLVMLTVSKMSKMFGVCKTLRSHQ